MRFLVLALVLTSCVFAQMQVPSYNDSWSHHHHHQNYSLNIYPSSVTVEAGQFIQFTAIATSSDNVSFTPDNLQWRVSGNGGTIDGNGRFTASNGYSNYNSYGYNSYSNNSLTVEVRYHNTTATARVTIKESYDNQVATIQITPDNVQVAGGEYVQFTAQAYNRNNQPVSCNFQWNAAGGTINSNGYYHATDRPGTYQVVATDPRTNVRGFVNVQITYGNSHPMPPSPMPIPSNNARIQISDWDCGGGNFLAPKVKATVKVFGARVQTLKVYAVSGNGGYDELTTKSCKNGDTIKINEKYSRFTTDRIEFRLCDNRGNVLATESRNSK